jgi:hypothetical protein
VNTIITLDCGWGTFNKYLKGIESICNELNDNNNLRAILSTEGVNPQEVVKKAINWIIEKLKALASLIKQFFEKVNEYLNKTKNNKLLTVEARRLAVQKLINILNAYHNNEAVSILMSERMLFARYNASQVLASIPMKEFIKIYEDIINDVNRQVYKQNEDDKLVEKYNTYKEIIKTEFNKIKETSYKDIENVQNFINYKNQKQPSVDVLDHYDDIFMANNSIQNYMNGLNKAITTINTIIKTIENEKNNNNNVYYQNNRHDTTIFRTQLQQLRILQNQANLMSDIIYNLLSLQITQAIPSFHKAIVLIHNTEMPR